MTVFGNIEISETGRNCVQLRMHTVVEGNQGCLFTYHELAILIGQLQCVLKKRAARSARQRSDDILDLLD